MRPEIAELLVPHIYKSLENHESVLRYENVANIFGNLFFVNHSELENGTDDNRSHSNDHEATFLSELCRYFLNVGYEPNQITVLTTYTGQFFLLRKHMPRPEFEGVRITPVDNFQGEENDIILLSLVRSNEERKIGFLSISNRVCVALSRARKGLYIIGNGGQLRDESPLWRDILDTLKKQKKLVEGLPLGCRKHSEDTVFVKVAADFQNVPRGGCKYPCDFRLQCGHVCIKFCHELDSDHAFYECRKPCPKLCTNDMHRCRNLCFENCADCQELVERTLSRCGHQAIMCCYLKEESFICRKPCPKLCTNDMHCCRNLCFEICGDCQELVERTLSRCGHQATMCCYLKEESFICEQPCKLECTLGHPCQKLCFDICKCPILVTRTLTRCQHEATMPCYLAENEYRCKEPCKECCPFGHPCNRLCFQKCQPCPVLVTRILVACKHEAEMPCFFPEHRFQCKESCTKSCSSEHPCEKLCYEPCGDCMVPVTKILPICKHPAVIPCYMEERQYLLLNKCTVEVEITLPLCGHVVKLPCHVSARPYICVDSCKKSCSDGHPCEKKCHESCGVCRVRVERVLPRCQHTAMMPCYQRVDSYICQIKCNRACPAGHPCLELCHGKCDDCEIPVEKVLPSCGHKAKMPCHIEPSSHRCELPCERKCPEGHRCPKKCGTDCVNCNLKVQKVLPQCNHVNSVECHQSPSTLTCALPCVKSLLCGHKCQDICGAVKCTTKCKVKLDKELLCKHTANMECHQDPSSYVCHRKMKKTLPCGHVTNMECHEDPECYSCLQPVKKKLTCEHVATMACSLNPEKHLCRDRIQVVVCEYGHTKEVDCCSKETKFPPCVEMVNLTCSTELPNHAFIVQCKAQGTVSRSGCPKICDVEMDCGHRCTRICKFCVEQKRHGTCRLKCEKQFPLCIHKCEQYCSDECKPCGSRSLYICSHRKSSKSCSEQDDVCLKPCDWNCPHYSCTSVCSHPCNRPPCNHPCRKPLKCGHVCRGLCGEPCVSLCRRCKKNNFYEIAWSPFDKDESRFLELQPCRHIVEVVAMDAWFQDMLKSFPCTLDQRRFLVCPVCFEKVSFCPRYSQYIKRHESQLNSAKQTINKSKRLKKTATEYADAWLKSGKLNSKRLLLRHLHVNQRLRLGALCILQETEALTLQTKKSVFLETFNLRLENTIERVKTNNFYEEDDKTTSARDTILMYKFYMEAQINRLTCFIRGPKLRVLDKCKKDLKAFESIELVEDNFQRIWEIIEKLNCRLSQKLSPEDRRDDIENYVHHLNHFFDLELDATSTSQWTCCTHGHVYAGQELVDVNRIDDLCPFCHPSHKLLLYFLKPESHEIVKLDTTGYYQRNSLDETASGFGNRTRKETRKSYSEREQTPVRIGAATRGRTGESAMPHPDLEGGTPTSESVPERGRGGPRGSRGRGRFARGSQADRNSEYLQSRHQEFAKTNRDRPTQATADIQRSSDSQRYVSGRTSRGCGRGRGRGTWSMEDRMGIEQPIQTTTHGESTTTSRRSYIPNVNRGNLRENRQTVSDRRDSRHMQIPTERSNDYTPAFRGRRGSQSHWCDTVRTQLENIQAAGRPDILEKQKNDSSKVTGGQDEDTNRSLRNPSGSIGSGPTQNSRGKYKRGSRGRRPFHK